MVIRRDPQLANRQIDASKGSKAESKNILFLRGSAQRQTGLKEAAHRNKRAPKASPDDIRRMYALDKIKRHIAPNMLLDAVSHPGRNKSHVYSVMNAKQTHG